MRLILLLRVVVLSMVTGFSIVPALAATAPVADADGDGVDVYEDFCPETPAGAKVWTKADYDDGRAPSIKWVGCAGNGDSWDGSYNPPARPRPPSHFDSVSSLYVQGTAINFEQAAGWYSGRCYLRNSPDRASPAFIWLETRSIDGPAFPSAQKFSFVSDHNEIGADAYDVLTDDLRASISGTINANWDRLPVAQRSPDGLTLFESDSDFAYAQFLRVNGDYLVAVRGTPQVQEVCYFFKKLSPEAIPAP